MVYNENLAVNFIEGPLYGMTCFSLDAVKILSLPFDSMFMLCLGMDLWVYSSVRSLSSLDAQINVFHHIWEVFSHFSFKYSFCPFHSLISIWTYITHMLVYFMVSHRSLMPCLFLFILISFYSSDWIISMDPSQLFCLFCLLKYAVELL